MSALKAERGTATASKVGRATTRTKSKSVKAPPADDDVGGADEENNQPLRLFKHTLLPANVDDDNTAETATPATHSSASTSSGQPSNPSSGVNDDNDAQSQATVHLTLADYDTLSSLYNTIATTATQLRQHVQSHLASLPTQPSTAAGNSLYELKNRLLLQYIERMVHVIRLRVNGESIADEPAVDDMNEIRVILERIRPMEKRIKYSIDRLLTVPAETSAVEGGGGSVDPLHYRPNPLDLVPVSASTATAVAASASRKRSSAAAALSPPGSPSASAVYQAPHHAPTLPTETRGRQPRVSASRLRSLYSELSDRPEERLVEGGGYGEMGEASDDEEERREYEERMMVRLVDTKEDKRRKRQREQRKALDNVDDYDELRQFVERRERTDRGGTSDGRVGADRRAGGGANVSGSSVDELFNGVERGEGRRKRAKTGGKKGKTGKGGKGRTSKRR